MKFELKYYVLDEHNGVVECDLITWGRFFEKMENRLVAYTEITSEINVSTIFIGIDHRMCGKGPPVLFETMVFGGEFDGYDYRYTSWDDAETGHKMMVARARAAIGQIIRHEEKGV
jgi:hypothetical protein